MLRGLTGCLRDVTVHIIAFRALPGGRSRIVSDVLCGMNGKLAATVRYRDPAGSRLSGRSAISARRAAMRTRYPSDPRRRSQPVVLVVNPTPSQRHGTSRHASVGPSQNAKIRLTFRTRKVNVKKAKLNRPHSHRAKPLPGLAQLHNCVLRVPTVFVASTRARGAKVPSGARRAQRRDCRAILFVAGLSASLVALSLRFISYSLSAVLISLSAVPVRHRSTFPKRSPP